MPLGLLSSCEMLRFSGAGLRPRPLSPGGCHVPRRLSRSLDADTRRPAASVLAISPSELMSIVLDAGGFHGAAGFWL